jgi:hypothetical protein
MTKEEYLLEVDKLYAEYIKSGKGEVSWYELAESLVPLTIRYKEELA